MRVLATPQIVGLAREIDRIRRDDPKHYRRIMSKLAELERVAAHRSRSGHVQRVSEQRTRETVPPVQPLPRRSAPLIKTSRCQSCMVRPDVSAELLARLRGLSKASKDQRER
jgi:hypothetical protein